MFKTISAGDAKLQVLDTGSGPPILFVHGFPLDHAMWRYQIEHFKGRHRVIAPDLRGFGGSRSSRQADTLKTHADDLAALLAALNVTDPIIFCGLSFGGYVAWHFWKHYPHALQRLILCDTRSQSDSPEVARGRRMMAQRVLAEGTEFVIEGMLPKLLAPSTRDSNPDVVEQVTTIIRSTDPAAIAATQNVMADRPDMTAELSSVNLPTLVICGEHDVITPPDEMRAMAEKMPDARFVFVPDGGHMSPLEKPTEVNHAIEHFLRETGI
jgi:pimeloyl-ACP methyl ester carboxylesterase